MVSDTELRGEAISPPELLEKGNSWLRISHPELTADLLRERLKGADILLADLDDTDAPSPAKEIARRLMKTASFNPKILNWARDTAWGLVKNGKRAESGLWEKLLKDCRRDKKLEERLRKIIDEYTSRWTLNVPYPGVAEFYQALSCQKIYISRNIEEVLAPFAKTFGFSRVFPERFEKLEELQKILAENPQAKRFIVRGDSYEDGQITSILEEKQRRGEIDDVVSICVCQKRQNGDFPADIDTSTDQTLLSEILKGKL